MGSIKVVRSLDAMPPVTFENGVNGDAYSTRVLEHQHRAMFSALELIATTGMDAKQCADLAKSTLENVLRS